MRADILEDLIVKVEDSGQTEEAKAAFRRLIEQVGIENNVSRFKQQQRINFVLNLHRLGEKRPLICERLQAHFHISESQANRDIGAAFATL